MTGRVRLAPVDEQTLEPLLSMAVAEAEPVEVMPPVPGPPGWSEARREAFREFHRARYGGLDGPTRTVMYAIHVGGDVVGMIRMSHTDEPGTMETGMWLGRSARGQGIGVAALRSLLEEATQVGAKRVVANTTAANHAAVGVLVHAGAVMRQEGEAVRAELAIER